MSGIGGNIPSRRLSGPRAIMHQAQGEKQMKEPMRALAIFTALVVLGCNVVGTPHAGTERFACSNKPPGREDTCLCSLIVSGPKVSQCDPSMVRVPAGAVGRCCLDYVTAGNTRIVYQCSCFPAVCLMSTTSCQCVRGASIAPNAGAPVASCDGFVAAHTGVTCCAGDTQCTCGVGRNCSTLERMVPSCGPDHVCDPAHDHEPVATCP